MPYLGCKKGMVFQIQIFHPVQNTLFLLHPKYDDNDHLDPSWAFFTFVILAKHKQMCDWDMFHHCTVGCVFLNLNRVLESYLNYSKTITRRVSAANHRHGNLQLLKFSRIDFSWHHVLALLKHGSSWWRMQGGALLYTRMRNPRC